VRVEGLGAAASYSTVPGAWFEAGWMSVPPAWDGSDAWPVRFESTLGGSTDTPAMPFPSAYMTERVWVSGGPAPVSLGLPSGGLFLSLSLHRAIVTMEIPPSSDTVSRGIIAGILDTGAYVEEVRKFAGALDPGLCSGPTIESIANHIRHASDILVDGSQDPGKPCNGISVGLGFTATRAKLGSVLPPEPPPPDPCDQAQ
jgi:hypothetical protein